MTTWFGTQIGPSTFGIFDALPSELGSEAHLAGDITAALAAKPNIEKVDAGVETSGMEMPCR